MRNLRLSIWICTGIALGIPGAIANPTTTVSWNGDKGAVSFTFDDGCGSQLTNVIPALKQRGLHATFCIPGFATSSTWVDVAKDGNEIANHTVSHLNLTEQDSATIFTEISGQTKALQNLDASIFASTLAYPGCPEFITQWYEMNFDPLA